MLAEVPVDFTNEGEYVVKVKAAVKYDHRGPCKYPLHSLLPLPPLLPPSNKALLMMMFGLSMGLFVYFATLTYDR
jgi:hypothetical protein